MLERESAYDALISGAKTQPYSARTLRGSEALARLRECQYQINTIIVDNFEQKDFDERLTFEKSGTGSSSTQYDKKHAAPDAGLEDIKTRLDSLCWEECTAFLRACEEVADEERYREVAAALHTDESAMDTSILQRIKNGEGPHHEAFDDLLAPLRSQPLLLGTEESQEDMLEVLLAWNKRIADDRNEDLTARQTFIAALTERVRVVDKVLAIVSDSNNSNQNDEVGQDGILEPSQRWLLKAIHTYQPETRTFKNQDPFDMLVVILAHMEAFDIADKDDCVYLTFKVLSGQDQLEHRFIREKRRCVYEKKEADAEEVDDRDGVRRSKTKWRAYNKKMAERARRRLMTRIQCARNELRKVGIEELLKLAVLRTAQPRIDREAPPDVYSPSWEKISDKCAQADDYDTLNDELGKHFPDLEAKVEVTVNNAQDIKMAQDMILFRAVKLAGADLRDVDKVERDGRMTARQNDPATARLMEETLEGVSDTRLVVKHMVEHLATMGQSLCALLEAAATKEDDLVELTRLLNREESRKAGSELQDEEGEKDVDDGAGDEDDQPGC